MFTRAKVPKPWRPGERNVNWKKLTGQATGTSRTTPKYSILDDEQFEISLYGIKATAEVDIGSRAGAILPRSLYWRIPKSLRPLEFELQTPISLRGSGGIVTIKSGVRLDFQVNHTKLTNVPTLLYGRNDLGDTLLIGRPMLRALKVGPTTNVLQHQLRGLDVINFDQAPWTTGETAYKGLTPIIDLPSVRQPLPERQPILLTELRKIHLTEERKAQAKLAMRVRPEDFGMDQATRAAYLGEDVLCDNQPSFEDEDMPALMEAKEVLITETLEALQDHPQAAQRIKKAITETSCLHLEFQGSIPCLLEPYVVKLKEGVTELPKPTPRRTPKNEEERLAAREFTAKMVKYGVLEPVAHPNCASQMLSFRKTEGPGKTKWRYVLDLRAVNKLLAPQVNVLPTIAEEVRKLFGKKYYASFDLIKGFWLMTTITDRLTRDIFVYQTADGCFRSKRLPQGATPASTAFHASLRSALRKAGFTEEQIAHFVDDITLCADTAEELADLIERFFRMCEVYGLQVGVLKSTVAAMVAKFCGHVVTQVGWRLDPKYSQALKAFPNLSTAEDLSKLIGSTGWLRNSIGHYSALEHPLRCFLRKMTQLMAAARTQSSRR